MTMQYAALPAIAFPILSGCSDPGPTREDVCAHHRDLVRESEEARALLTSIYQMDGIVTDEEQANLDESAANLEEFRGVEEILCKAD